MLQTIGKLARAEGIAAETLRYYERIGLLLPEARSEAGYRLYGEDARRRLRFIRRAQALGFTLSEIRELLALGDEPEGSMADVKALAAARMADIEQRIADLQRMRDALGLLHDRCPGHGPRHACPILESLAGEEH
ncbi:MAG: heavy metal-responsive transcriptional regulator [Gammaproteobacteria bacterium]|nr:MAG: heavy metal-responsive transcriptional regulator [Gammaproteobacteria bacterium]